MLECEEDSQKSLDSCKCQVQDEGSSDCCKAGFVRQWGKHRARGPHFHYILWPRPVQPGRSRGGRGKQGPSGTPIVCVEIFFFFLLTRVVSSDLEVCTPSPRNLKILGGTSVLWAGDAALFVPEGGFPSPSSQLPFRLPTGQHTLFLFRWYFIPGVLKA